MPDQVQDAASEAQLETADRAATQSTAKQIAGLIATAATKAEAGAVQEQAVETKQAAQKEQAEQTQTDETVKTEAEAEQAEEEQEKVDLTEVEQALVQAGIDLGITAADVPQEFVPVYERLVQQAADLASTLASRELEATQQLKAVEDFRERLEKSPDRVLLTIAVTQPDVFKKVVEVFTEMQQDQRVKDMVVRELQSEARLQEAQRMEAALAERDSKNRAAQVIVATKHASRQHGIDYVLAEKVVALAIQANGGEFGPGDVDQVVADLAGQKAKPQKVRLASPAKAAAVKSAPTQSTQGTGAPAASPGLTDAGSTREKGGGIFRKLVGEASKRLASVGQ